MHPGIPRPHGSSRRDFLRQGLAGLAYLPLVGNKRWLPTPPAGPGLGFEAIPPSILDAIQLPPGYRHTVLLRWGDPVLRGAPSFDVDRQSAEAQAMQFGFNCDYIAFFPLPEGSGRPDQGLLLVNHEYTNPELMFDDWDPAAPTARQADIQLAAHGVSLVEVFCDAAGVWHALPDSPRNRRITGSTPIPLSGPALGHPWLRTAAEPSGSFVLGTLGNCAGGVTPWGTCLVAEENFHEYFGHRDAMSKDDDPRFDAHVRYGLPRKQTKYRLEAHHDRFHLGHQPGEPFRFGWVLEIDPYDPSWTPRKRTALGRLRREGATVGLCRDGRAAVYSGEDIPFEHVYKFVSQRAWTPNDRLANRDLLDNGTLYAARFGADGRGAWLPLAFGDGNLAAGRGFADQADVLVRAVMAADALGATTMDRPEGIAIHPDGGRVYIALTKNPDRDAEGQPPTNPANPRANNRFGHIIELVEDSGDLGSLSFSWSIFILCGDPAERSTWYAGHPKSQVSALACPDNLVFDPRGNLWIATDGQPDTLGMNDGLYAVPVDGAERGRTRRFCLGVPGSEVTGPCFGPGGGTLFLSIQHPGEGGDADQPRSSWPDGSHPPRPSVVAIQTDDGRPIGSPGPELRP
ncbi:MAG: PhoX family phosphatase [Chloroflexi bacterium]|nr:PhoX family phosphatase [Chloroflexota bacterium]